MYVLRHKYNCDTLLKNLSEKFLIWPQPTLFLVLICPMHILFSCSCYPSISCLIMPLCHDSTVLCALNPFPWLAIFFILQDVVQILMSIRNLLDRPPPIDHFPPFFPFVQLDHEPSPVASRKQWQCLIHLYIPVLLTATSSHNCLAQCLA